MQVDLSDGSKGGFVVSCLSCFGGGVILTTALTHMLPEVNLFLQYNIQQGQLIDKVRVNSQSFLKIFKMEFQGWPLAEIWVLCGFFMVYFVEEVGKIEQNRYKSPGAQSTKKNSLCDTHSDEALQRRLQAREASKRCR